MSVRRPLRSVDPIVAQLRQIRIRRDLTQSAVAQACKRKRHPQVVHEWEQGRHDPSLRNLHNWCFALGFRLVLLPIESHVPARVPDQAERREG